MWPPSENVQASAKKVEAAIQYPEYSDKPLMQKSKIREDIPIKIKDATSMRNIAANIPENL